MDQLTLNENRRELSANHRILVADDDAMVLRLYEKTFPATKEVDFDFSYLFDDHEEDNYTFQLTTVSQGEEAVESVRVALAEGKPFAVVFLDERMPPGIGGLESAKQIREIDPNVHIVVSSAHSDYAPSDYRRVIFSHLYFMRKPINVAELEHMAYNACMSWNRNQQLQAELNSNIAYRIWLNRLFDALPVPVVVLDVDTRQVIMNGGPIRMAHDATTCYQQLYRMDSPCSDAHGGCPLQQVKEEGVPAVIQHEHDCGTHGTRRFELHCIPIHNELGEIKQMLEFSIDITEQEQRLHEKEVLVRQQKQLFDTFRSTAHTMKNSISYLNGMTERMASIEDRSGELGELLTPERVTLFREQVTMIFTMLQLALGSAKEGATEVGMLSLQDKIEETLSLFAISSQGRGKLIDLNMPKDRPLCIQISLIDCQTMLLNLLNNAADAVDSYLNSKLVSGNEEDIELLMKIQDESMIAMSLKVDAGDVVIELSNVGDPIPEELQEAIFQQGFSRKEHGNGVGLYDVRQIIRQARGTISVCNSGERVLFTVRLPLMDCASETVTG